ncbi:MAG: DUF2281 domain-containing protein [Synechocystis sp.]|jgi:hypothetical protein
MITIKVICHNGQINLMEPLPKNLEGKEVSVTVQTVEPPTKKRRQRGSAKGLIWLAPDFDEPLEDFEEYLK